MSASAIETTRRLVNIHKADVIDNAAVIVAGLAVLISAFSLLFGGVALYAAHVANERTTELQGSIDVYRIRAAKLNAYLAAHGIDTKEIYGE